MTLPARLAAVYPSGMTVAVFDFDGTLTRVDSFPVFLAGAVPPLKLAAGLAALSPSVAAMALGRLANWRLKEAFLTRFFAGLPLANLQEKARRFSSRRLPWLVRPAGLERIRWHQEQGHRVVIASASLELYLRMWAESVGVEDVLGTRLEIRDGVVTGKILGSNCWGPEKVVRLTELLGTLQGRVLYAYGDGEGDRELLGVATHAAYRSFQPGS